ncbi:MAG: hypothetical protein RLY86_2189 [Pseudomonadota bacterium]|jgi:hypothetical protein
MLRHSALILLEVAAGALAIGALGAGIVAWRLQQGPLELEWLTPYVEQALNQDSPVTVAIDRTVVSWSGFGAPPVVQALGIVARGESGAPVATVPELRIAFSLPALLRGRVAPAAVELVAPRLSAIRAVEGTFHLDIRNDTGPDDPAATDRILTDLVTALRSPPDPTEPLGALTSLRITDAVLAVENRQTGTAWTVPRFGLSLARDASGVRGTASADLDLGGRINRLDATVVYRVEDGGLGVTADLADVRPADFSQIAPVLAPLQALDVAFGGSVTLDLDGDLRPLGLTIDLTGGAGTLSLPDHLPEPVALETVRLKGRLDDAGRHLSIQEFLLDLGEPTLAVTGDVHQRTDTLDMSVRLTLAALPMADLPRYWPEAVKPNIRNWMTENLADGRFDETVFTLTGFAPLENRTNLVVEDLSARFALSGFTVHYRKPLPPMRGVDATATFDGKSLDIAITRGGLFDLAARAGSVRIHGLDTPNHAIDIHVPLTGPLPTALRVLDHEPLGYASKVNLVPDRTAGNAAIDLRFAFPLVKDLRMDDVRLSGTAHLTDVSVPDVVADIDATEGVLDLAVTGKDLTMNGTARLNGVPATIEWQEWFPDSEPAGTRVRVQARPDDGERARFNLSFPDWIDGPVGVDMTYLRPRGERQRIEATLDLTPARLKIALMDWEKPAGKPGSGDLVVEFIDGRPVLLPRFQVTTEELSASGRLRLWPQDYQIQRLVLETFRLKDTTDARIELTRGQDGAMTVAAEGAAFDLRPLKGDPDPAPGEVPPPPPSPEEKAKEPPLDLVFSIGTVTTGEEGQSIAAVAGTASRRGGAWDRANVDALVGEEKPLKVRYWPESGSLLLTVESEDAGAALNDLALLRHVRGGKLVVTGRSDPMDPTRTVAGRIELTDYRVQGAPVLARLLAAASPQGFAEFLSGAPLSFDRLTGEFFWHDRGISFRDLRTSGNAVGLTLEGDIDVVEGTGDLQGTVVPFSAVNRLLGVVPLIGTLLTGGEGQGLIAATYRLSGPLDNLDVGVNPLAMLTPGFLRNLFFMPEPAGQSTAVPGNQPTPGDDGGAATAVPTDPGAAARTTQPADADADTRPGAGIVP